MQTPEYKFYLGKEVKNVSVARRKYVNSDGTIEDIDDDEYVAVVAFVSGYEALYIDAEFKATMSSRPYCYAYFRGGDGAITGKASLSPRGSSYAEKPLVKVPKGSVQVVISATASDARELFSTRLERPLYSVKKCLPHYKELSKRYVKDEGQMFFRQTLEGDIKLFASDYEYVSGSSLEDELLFLVRKKSATNDEYEPMGWTEYFTGWFNKTNCKIDHGKKMVELEVTPRDAYTRLMNGASETYDLIKLNATRSPLNLYKRLMLQAYVRGGSSVSCFANGTYWEQEVGSKVDKDEDLTKAHFCKAHTFLEVNVSGVRTEGVNGAYAGADGLLSQNSDGGYRFYVSKLRYIPVDGAYKGYLCIAPKSEYIEPGKTEASGLRSATEWYIDKDTLFPLSGKNFTPYAGSIPMRHYYKDATDGQVKFYEFTADLIYYPLYLRYVCDADNVGGCGKTSELSVSDFVSDNRNMKRCVAATNVKSVAVSCEKVSAQTKYGKDDYGKFFINEAPLLTEHGRLLPICRNEWANASLWYWFDDVFFASEKSARTEYVIEDAYSVADVIKALLGKIDPSLEHEATADYSQFLYGDMPLNEIEGSIRAYIVPKSNILKGNYDQAAQKAEITLSDVMELLRACFKCYMFVADGKLKIEHIKYFMNGGSYSDTPAVQLDLTKLRDRMNGMPYSYMQSEVSYDKSELAKRYEFKWMDNVTEIFDGTVLTNESNYAEEGKVESVTLSKFTSDIDYMVMHPEEVSNDGYALICTEEAIVHWRDVDVISQTTHFAVNGLTGEFITDPSMYPWLRYYGGAYFGPLSGYKSVTFTEPYMARSYLGFAFFDEDHNFLGGAVGDTYDDLDEWRCRRRTVTIPKGAHHIHATIQSHSAETSQYIKPLNVTLAKIVPSVITDVTLWDDDGEPYNASVQNWRASWNFLQRLYAYDAPSEKVKSNDDKNYRVYGIKKCMTADVTAFAEEEPSETGLVKTSVGNGVIEEMSVNMNNREVTFNLVFEPK